MNEKIIKYLQDNKNKHSKVSLCEALKRAGYKEDDIFDALNKVYGQNADKTCKSSDFWDFRTKKIYCNTWEKLIDLFVGATAIFILNKIIKLFFTPNLFYGSSYEIAIFYGIDVLFGLFLLKNRKFIAYGGFIYIAISIISIILLVIGIIFMGLL